MASQPIYQFCAELCHYQPKIWRRFQVAGNVTMARLGDVFMTLFEMQASHLEVLMEGSSDKGDIPHKTTSLSLRNDCKALWQSGIFGCLRSRYKLSA